MQEVLGLGTGADGGVGGAHGAREGGHREPSGPDTIPPQGFRWK
jgi:hypothetical protein